MISSGCSVAWADLAFPVQHGRTDPCPELDTGLDAVVPESHFQRCLSWLHALLARRGSVTPLLLSYVRYAHGGWSLDPEELYDLKQITQASEAWAAPQ